MQRAGESPVYYYEKDCWDACEHVRLGDVRSDVVCRWQHVARREDSNEVYKRAGIGYRG